MCRGVGLLRTDRSGFALRDRARFLDGADAMNDEFLDLDVTSSGY
jgi:hypothetical protein